MKNAKVDERNSNPDELEDCNETTTKQSQERKCK